MTSTIAGIDHHQLLKMDWDELFALFALFTGIGG